MRIARRLGTAPPDRGCNTNATCPDVFQLASGDYAVIGRLVDEGDLEGLPPDAGIGPEEAVVVVPRGVMEAAMRELAGA